MSYKKEPIGFGMKNKLRFSSFLLIPNYKFGQCILIICIFLKLIK